MISMIRIMAGGQSLIHHLFTENSAAGKNALIASVNDASVEVYDGAIGSSAMMKTVGDDKSNDYHVDDSNPPFYSDGVVMSNYVSVCNAATSNNPSLIDVVIFEQWQGENASISDSPVAGQITPEEYKAGVVYLINRFRSLHGADTPIIFGIPHRAYNRPQYDESTNHARNVYLELGKLDNIYLVEHIDLDIKDWTHHTDSAYEEFGARFGKMINYALGIGDKPEYPEIYVAEFDGYNKIRTRFTNPCNKPSSGMRQLTIFDGQDPRGAANITEIDTRTIDMDGFFSENTVLHMGYGANHPIAQTSPTLWNDDLPAVHSVIPVSIHNVVINLDRDHLSSFVDFGVCAKPNVGGNIEEPVSQYGQNFHIQPPNTGQGYPSYLSALYNHGGIYAVDDALRLGYLHASSDYHTVLCAVEIPTISSGQTPVFSFGDNSEETDLQSRLYVKTDGHLYYSKDDNNDNVLIYSDFVDNPHVVLARFDNGTTSIFVDDEVPVIFTADADYKTCGSLSIFGYSTHNHSVANQSYGGVAHWTKALSGAEVYIVMQEFKNRFL